MIIMMVDFLTEVDNAILKLIYYLRVEFYINIILE